LTQEENLSKRHIVCGKKIMPSTHYSEPLVLLYEDCSDLEELSRRFRAIGVKMTPDTYVRIMGLKVVGTAGIPLYPEVLVDTFFDDLHPKRDVAIEALVLHELIAIARVQNNKPTLGALLFLAESLYRRERPKAQDFVAHLLDYVQMCVTLIKVTGGFVLIDPDLGPDPDYEYEQHLRRAALRGDAAIEGLRASNNKASKFFLVRAIENRMVVAAELDERSKSAKPHSHIKAFAAKVAHGPAQCPDQSQQQLHEWGCDLLIETARKTKVPVFAWNGAELAGAGDQQLKAEEALTLLFELRPPKDGAVSLADGEPNLVVEEYLAIAFASAIRKFSGSK
jgi:hypothetical protein